MLDQKTELNLRGYSIIDGQSSESAGAAFNGVDPATGASLEPVYHCASPADVDRAANLAEEAFVTYRKLSGREKARFLRSIADGIEAIVPELVERANRETALPEARLKGESARTINQLRLFAQVIEEGSWVNARIDPAQPDRKPLPRSDIRSMLKPLGPVAVFGASNFPLAFSVAGGDTAAAFAAGNPVIVKAHHAHPGTSEMVGQVIARSVRECGLPSGVFALLFGAGSEIGAALVDHPKVKAVGFTGSLSAGKALMQRAAARPEPIPCFMEMSSVNPLFVLPEALHTRGAQIAARPLRLVHSWRGPVLHQAGAGLSAAQCGCRRAGRRSQSARGKVLSFAHAHRGNLEELSLAALPGSRRTAMVETVAQAASNGASNSYAAPVLMQIGAEDLLGNPELATEVFGPSTLVIRYDSREELMELAGSIEGQLTATLHGTEADLAAFADLIAILERKAGRLIVNGFPTGVEVCHAMVHGGPYPATSDSRATSVGTYSIYRFVRPVCYQDFPQASLPEELKNGNPLGIMRLVDGQLTRDAIA